MVSRAPAFQAADFAVMGRASPYPSTPRRDPPRRCGFSRPHHADAGHGRTRSTQSRCGGSAASCRRLCVNVIWVPVPQGHGACQSPFSVTYDVSGGHKDRRDFGVSLVGRSVPKTRQAKCAPLGFIGGETHARRETCREIALPSHPQTIAQTGLSLGDENQGRRGSARNNS